MALPLFLTWDQAQGKWKSQLDPVLGTPILAGRLISDYPVVSGANVINHGLGRNLQGWVITRNNSSVTFYDTQASNQTPQLTLNLTASGPATISLWVF